MHASRCFARSTRKTVILRQKLTLSVTDCSRSFSMATSSKERPEHQGPAQCVYSPAEVKRYSNTDSTVRIQHELTDRALQLLGPSVSRNSLVLDLGCGSGFSGDVLSSKGFCWIGMDVSEHMLEEASCRKRGEEHCMGDLILADFGQGLPFRDGAFDVAVSISAVQWLCYKPHGPQSISRFFGTLRRCLRRDTKAVMQVYLADAAQRRLLLDQARKAGFKGGLFWDVPHSKGGKKSFLCLSHGQLIPPSCSTWNTVGAQGPKAGLCRRSDSSNRNALARCSESPVDALNSRDDDPGKESGRQAKTSDGKSTEHRGAYPEDGFSADLAISGGWPYECPLGFPVGGSCTLQWEALLQSCPKGCLPVSSPQAKSRTVHEHHVLAKRLNRLLKRAVANSNPKTSGGADDFGREASFWDIQVDLPPGNKYGTMFCSSFRMLAMSVHTVDSLIGGRNQTGVDLVETDVHERLGEKARAAFAVGSTEGITVNTSKIEANERGEMVKAAKNPHLEQKVELVPSTLQEKKTRGHVVVKESTHGTLNSPSRVWDRLSLLESWEGIEHVEVFDLQAGTFPKFHVLYLKVAEIDLELLGRVVEYLKVLGWSAWTCLAGDVPTCTGVWFTCYSLHESG